MVESFEFLQSVLNAITEHIVVINSKGDIVFVNESWRSFGRDNDCLADITWQDFNYLRECDNAAAMGDDFGLQAAAGIRSVMSAEKAMFHFEYPCNSPRETRWFMMRVVPFIINHTHYFVISHQNITERKLAEEQVLALSRIDTLTNIPNRRYFDEFLSNEWRRCQRHNQPITLALLDLDYFKLINDTYGHQQGDECLKAVAALIKNSNRRANDLCARYGGEEFIMAFSNTDTAQAKPIIDGLLADIRALNIANKYSPINATLTASIGVASMYPSTQNSAYELIKRADQLLYRAKMEGRNRVYFA